MSSLQYMMSKLELNKFLHLIYLIYGIGTGNRPGKK